MSSRPVGRWFFGKLPAQGDFVSRGLDHPLRDSLDLWLSQEMQQARSEFADFDERYDCAPAWNFVDQDMDGQWSGGALCASVDKAGRRFPVVMAAPAGDPAEAVALSGACLAALYEAFSGGWDADSLHCSQLPPLDIGWNPTSAEWVLLGEDGPAVAIPGRFPQGIVRAMVEFAQ